VVDVIDGVIRRRGKAIGTVDASTIRIGARTYTVELSNPRTLHDFPTWTATVKLGDTVVLVSDEASALCAAMRRDRAMTEADHQDEIRRRLAYYLVWRDLGL